MVAHTEWPPSTVDVVTRTSSTLRPAALRFAAPALLLLAACGSGDGDSSGLSPADVSQTVEFTATEYEFGADAATTITPGEVVRFRLTNIGSLDHEMQVLDATGRLIDRIDRIAPGDSGDVLLRFEEAGQYQLICDIDDHLSRDQRAVFSIAEPVSE